MTLSATAIWSTIIGLVIATYLIRFSFLGLLGDWRPPGWAERMLRYLPMAMLPALAAPMVVFPKAAEAGDRLAAAARGAKCAAGRAGDHCRASDPQPAGRDGLGPRRVLRPAGGGGLGVQEPPRP